MLDHSGLDQELLKNGVDPTAYWNVWRLTPEVYRTADKTWVVKHDFDKLDTQLLADKIEYVFATTIDVVLGLHAARKAIKTSGYGRYYLELRKDCVSVYEKADKTSKVVATSHLGYSDSTPTIRSSVSTATHSIGTFTIQVRTIDSGVSFTLMMSRTANPL